MLFKCCIISLYMEDLYKPAYEKVVSPLCSSCPLRPNVIGKSALIGCDDVESKMLRIFADSEVSQDTKNIYWHLFTASAGRIDHVRLGLAKNEEAIGELADMVDERFHDKSKKLDLYVAEAAQKCHESSSTRIRIAEYFNTCPGKSIIKQIIKKADPRLYF